jgi:hypothetical protein
MPQPSTGGSLTGRWIGHYSQRDQQRGLEAELSQDGQQLSGSMRDAQTTFEVSVFEMAADGGLPPGADEQIVSALRRQFPDEPNSPIKATSTLPTDSRLEGRVHGRTVEFLKIYQGEAFCGYRVGERQVGTTLAGHSVSYQGQVSPDGNTIEGRWFISADPTRGTRRSEGSFVLRRREPDA